MNTYIVIDINSPLLAELPTFEAKNGKEAVQKYLKEQGFPPFTIKRRGDNFVTWAAQKVEIIEGRKYRRGNRVWYGVAQ